MRLGEAMVRPTNRPPRLQEIMYMLRHAGTGMAVVTGHDGHHPIGFLTGPPEAHGRKVLLRPPRLQTTLSTCPARLDPAS